MWFCRLLIATAEAGTARMKGHHTMMLRVQAENRESSLLALDWSCAAVATGSAAETDACLSLLQPVHKFQPMLSCPAASQQITSEAAQSPAEEAQATAKMEARSRHVSNIAVSEAVPLQQPTVVAPVAVSMQDMPQLVLEQPHHATASIDQPQPTPSMVNQAQPASQKAASKEEEQWRPAIADEGLQSQAAAANMNSPSAALASKADQSQLATAGWSQPQAADTAPETDSISATTFSQADQPQLATPVEARPQPAVPRFLDLLFPPEQLQAPPRNPPSSSPADSSAVPEPPVLHAHTGKHNANGETCCMLEDC